MTEVWVVTATVAKTICTNQWLKAWIKMVTWVKSKLASKSFQRKLCGLWRWRASPTLRFQTVMDLIASKSQLCCRPRPITLSSIKMQRRYKRNQARMRDHLRIVMPQNQGVTVRYSLKTEPLHPLILRYINGLSPTHRQLEAQRISQTRTYHHSSLINPCNKSWSSRRQLIVMRTYRSAEQQE